MSVPTWPPADTPAFLVDNRGVEPVLIRRRLPGDLLAVSRKHGTRVYNPETKRLERHWATSTLFVPLDDLFATEAAARAVFNTRRMAKAAA